MKNTTTKTNSNLEETKTTIPNHIKIGDVSIFEPDENESKKITVQLQIPVRFHLHGKRSLNEYEAVSVEELRTKSSTLFELTEFLGSLLRVGDYKAETIGEFINVIGTIGQGLMEATERVAMDFERYQAEVAQ